MTPLGRQNPAEWSVEGLRALLCCGILALCLVAGITAQAIFGWGWTGGGVRQPQLRLQPQQDAVTEEEVGTASILFVPFRGDECQHNLFDNKTGEIWHSGSVSCEAALISPGKHKSKAWSAARTEAIRGSFRWK